MILNAKLVCAYWIDIAFAIDRVSVRASKLRQIIFSIIFASLLLIFVFIVDFALHTLRPDAVHLLLTTGPLFCCCQQKSNLVCQQPTTPRPVPPRLQPQLLLLLILFSSRFLLLSVAQEKLKQGVRCCC